MKNTTDNQNEIFDVVDENDNVVGQVNRREANRSPNIIHRSISVAVFNKKGEMFLQKRSETKDTDPGKWTISCSGHVNSGDNYENTAKRELVEELGVRNLELKQVAKYICRAPKETEITVLYKAKITKEVEPLLRFNLNKEEISEGKFFTQKELLEPVRLGKLKLSFMGKIALEKLGWL